MAGHQSKMPEGFWIDCLAFGVVVVGLNLVVDGRVVGWPLIAVGALRLIRTAYRNRRHLRSGGEGQPRVSRRDPAQRWEILNGMPFVFCITLGALLFLVGLRYLDVPPMLIGAALLALGFAPQISRAWKRRGRDRDDS
jgi:hypothetical protein